MFRVASVEWQAKAIPEIIVGVANSRIKDFYDMEVLSRTFSFGGKSLREAIHNTFERRGTELPLAVNGSPSRKKKIKGNFRHLY